MLWLLECAGTVDTTAATAALTDDAPALLIPLEVSTPDTLWWSTIIGSISSNGGEADPLPEEVTPPAADDVDTNGDSPWTRTMSRARCVVCELPRITEGQELDRTPLPMEGSERK